MSSSIAILAPPTRAEELRQLLDGTFRLVGREEGGEAPDCLLVVHEPPEWDALIQLARLSEPEGLPGTAVVVVSTGGAPRLRRAALRAGAMEVLERERLDPETLAAAVVDAMDRFSVLRRASRRPGEPSHTGEQFALRVINNLFAFVGVLDMSGTLLYVNEAPVAAAGIPIEEVRGKTFWDCYWWNYSDAVREQLRAACERAARGEVVRYDVVVRMVGDTRMTIDFQVAPLRDDRGRITHLIPSAVDITKRRQAEAELQEREQRLAFHVENSPLAVVEWGPDFRCTRWTGQAEAMFGWRPEEVLGRHPYEWPFVHEGDRAATNEVLKGLITGGTQRSIHSNRNYRRDGSVGDYEWYNSARLDEQGRLVSVLSLVLDVSERRAAEAALVESESRFRTIVEAAPSIAFIMGPDGTGGYANSRWEEYFGLSLEEASRRGWRGLFHPLDEGPVLERWARCLETGEAFEVEYRILRRDGEARWHLGRTVPVRDARGHVTGWCGMITDIHRVKIAEDEVRHATELLKAVTETVADPIYAKDRQGHLLLANAATLRAIGKPAQEVIGHTELECLSDARQAEAIMATDRRIMETGRAETVEEVLTTPGGERVFLSAKAPLRDPAGEVIGLVGTSRDVTEQKQTEAALRASEARAREAAARAVAERLLLDAVLEAAPAGIILADANGKLVRFNPANELLWGPAPLSGSVDEYREWKGWWADSTERRGRRLEPHEWAMSRALRGETVRGDLVEIEPFDRPDIRRTMLNSAAPVRDAEGRVAGAVVAQMDITALVEAESARRESEARFRALADNIAQLAWIADETGSIFWYNRRWFEYTGTAIEEMKGWGWRKVHHPDHLERVEAKFRRHLESGEPWEDTFPLRGAGGEYRWFLSRAVPILDDAGRVARWFGTNTDVTAQREAQEALREADRRKDEFISILAHELRNPLAPVRNAVEILRRVGPAEPRVDRARDVIQRQVMHMARLIDDLLDVSRIARGKLELRKELCDLAAIARQTAEDYRTSLEAGELSLEVSASAGPVWVEGDPVRLAQMVGNLLHNAGRFTNKGGRVEVRVELDMANRLGVVRVADDGVGIEPALLSRLFDPFSQADQDLARSKGGLGLGLALTKGLAELHGGGVAAESEGPDRGATFTVRIPLSKARYEAASQQSPASQDRAGLRILVVEDNQDAAETLGDLLEFGGHTVRIVFDGARALTAAREFQPQVVISDIGLPGELDGYAVAQALRAEPVLRGVYLIALSGYANEEARRRSREAGFNAHFAKPPDIDRLERMLADLSSPSASV